MFLLLRCRIQSILSAVAMAIALYPPRRLGSSGASYGPSIFQLAEDDGGREVPARKDGDDSNACSSSSSSSSSSIGRNSDLSGRSSDGENSGENEVQSSYKGPLDMMESLEEVLPMRKGISTFYGGKSKSFTSLADAASSSSVKDIAKPENAYTRKRRSQLALNLVWDKNKSTPFRSNGGGISKRPITSSQSLLAMAVAISSSESNGSEDSSNSSSSSRSPPPRPPLHPQARISNASLAPSMSPSVGNFSTWRSCTLADLNQFPMYL